MQELSWSQDQNDFRVVFIAGNESFNQGSILWSDAIERAIESDVLVNTIYCGSAESKERELWASGLSYLINFIIKRIITNSTQAYPSP